MNKHTFPRLRHFEKLSSQNHMSDEDRYLSKPPTPTHNIVVIGAGTIGKEHMRVAHLLGRARVHGIFDTRNESAEIAEREFAEISSEKLVLYTDLESALKDPAVDAYFICTPNYTHYVVLRLVVVTGKPIFVEKPMATTVNDAVEMVKIVNEYSNFIQIGLQYRYKAQYQEAFHEALGRKTLGDVKTISVREYRPAYLDKVGQWNKFSEYSGGTLVEKSCHYFDLINLMAESQPVRVFASGGQAVNFLDFEKEGRSSDIDDHAFVIIEYENGIRANFTLNMFCADFDEEMIVVGEHGRLVAREKACFQQQKPTSSSIAIELGEQGASRISEVSYPRAIESSGHHGATFYEHIAFMDQLEGKQVESATAEQGLWSVIVAAAAQQSVATGEPVRIDKFLEENQVSL